MHSCFFRALRLGGVLTNKPSGCAFGLANDSTKPSRLANDSTKPSRQWKNRNALLSRLYSYIKHPSTGRTLVSYAQRSLKNARDISNQCDALMTSTLWLSRLYTLQANVWREMKMGFILKWKLDLLLWSRKRLMFDVRCASIYCFAVKTGIGKRLKKKASHNCILQH